MESMIVHNVCPSFCFAVYRHTKNTSVSQSLAAGITVIEKKINHRDNLSMRNKNNRVCLDLNSKSLNIGKTVLNSLRCQQNQHLLGVLEQEQQQETMRQICLQKLFDPREKVRSI
jgi:hypothetical protein